MQLRSMSQSLHTHLNLLLEKRRVEVGDFKNKIAVGKRREEIQSIVNSFNVMLKRLKDSKDLEDKYDEVKIPAP
jgi:hypothetical protein